MAAAPVTEAAADRTLEVVSSPRFPQRRLTVDWRMPGDPERVITVESAD
jgi:hypothetical protein